jgi:hypothetical protein
MGGEVAAPALAAASMTTDRSALLMVVGAFSSSRPSMALQSSASLNAYGRPMQKSRQWVNATVR